MEKEKTYKGFWKYMHKYIKPYYKKLVITMLGAIIVGVCVALQPLVIKYIVDDGISNNALSPDGKIKYVMGMCIVYLILAATRISLWRLAFINMLKSLEGCLFNLRSHFFAHVQHMCMRFYDKTSVGELFNCIMGSPMVNIKTYMNQMFISVPYQVVSFIISITALAMYDWMLTIILLATALIMAIFNFVSRQKIRTVFKDYIKTETEASHYLNDTLNGMDSIKLYSIEDNIFNVFKSFIYNMYEKGVKASFRQTAESMKPEFVQYLGTAVVYLVGTFSCVYRGMSVGILYAFLSSMGTILAILTSWLNIGLQKSSAEAGLYKIMQILDTDTSTPEIDKDHTRNIAVEKESARNNNKPCISFKDVTFGYDNKTIFEHFNCDIKYKESVALVGGSGSGKSTFTKLAMRLYDTNAGEVLVHGRDVREYSLHDLRITFGVVPQNPFIFYGSIWDNVLIARPDASNQEVMKAMEIAHVHEFVNDLQHGWNTVVGDGALGLSGGQKQRIAIARAILGNPDILIFDEATSALDNISERHIQQAMEELMKTHTVIIVAHRLSTIKNVDRILVFDNGKIVQEGTYNELAATEGEFKNLLNG
ncbi:MAG: ABC transporter ATP-binding protein [Clostridia bacterium]|nr:ABC transporter ATP-binding protein [Clostridia bacterium]